MRKVFVDTLLELASVDQRVFLLTADLGYTALEPFQQAFPDRFVNVGVAEQNMVGIGIGLAEAGYLPFLYSIAPFATLRPYEFIRNGGVHQGFPLRVVGIGGGFAYGTAGPSHHALEDYAVMRTLPGMMTLAPADVPQAAAILRATYNLPNPIYYRLDKNDRLVIPELGGRFSLDDIQMIRDGQHVLLLTIGSISQVGIAALPLLDDYGITAAAAVVSCLNPPPTDALCDLIRRFDVVVTVEEHYINGGLGSLAAEVIAENGLGTRLVRMGVRTNSDGVVGSESFLRAYHGLTSDAIAQAVLKVFSIQTAN